MRPSKSMKKRLRAIFSPKKAHRSLDPPKLENLEFLPHSMSLDGIAGGSSEETTPTTINGSSPAPRTSRFIDMPTRQSFANGTRFSSPPPEPDGMRSPSILSSQPGTPTNESAPVWSAAVGRASLGKSGRVIEKLMGENDMHRRDKALAKLQRDEEAKQHESTKAKYEALRISHDNLQVMHESDKAAIARKDRKIEELKAELESERNLRRNADNETKVARRERDEDVDKYRKQALQEQERSRGATNQYDVLMGSYKGQDQQYKRQTQKLRSDMRSLEEALEKERATVIQSTVTGDQAKKEAAKQSKINADLQAKFEAYKIEQTRMLEEIRRKADSNEQSADQALEEVRELAGQMRHTINIARDMRDPV